MKTPLYLAAAMATLINVPAFAAPVDASAPAPKAPAEMQDAVLTTQLLTLVKCGEKAKLDPESIKKSSTVYRFVVPVMMMGRFPSSNPNLAKGLGNGLKDLYCDEQGLLQKPVHKQIDAPS